MPNWSNLSGVISQQDRAIRAWMRIQRDPSSIDIVRNATTLAAQTVRLEFDNTNAPADSEHGRGSRRTLTVFGVRNHPTVADTDIEESDRFSVNGSIYRVSDVNSVVPGEVQAICEREI